MKKTFSTFLSYTGVTSLKKVFRGFYLVFTFVFAGILYAHFASAGSQNQDGQAIHPVSLAGQLVGPVKSVYDSLHLDSSGLSREAFEYARKGWEKLIEEDRLSNQSVITIADFSQPSTEKRLYVLDMKNYRLLFHTLVAHGRNSGQEWASSFSNELSSFKSSPGFYITGETYNGHNGYSLKLTGIEKGINDRAADRAIVMHGADYVNPSYIKTLGYIGRSQGCPAVSRQEAGPIINTIKNGACLFIYTPDLRYASRSVILTDSLS